MTEITNKHLRYEIKCMEDIVKGKESRGENADFEKRLLKAWGRYLETPPLSPQCDLRGIKAITSSKG